MVEACKQPWFQIALSLAACFPYAYAYAMQPFPADSSSQCAGPMSEPSCLQKCPGMTPEGSAGICRLYLDSELACCCPRDPINPAYCRLNPFFPNSTSPFQCLRWCCKDKQWPCGSGCCPVGMKCAYNFSVHRDHANKSRNFEACVDEAWTLEDQDRKGECLWGVGIDLRIAVDSPCCMKCLPEYTRETYGELFCLKVDSCYHCQRHMNRSQWQPKDCQGSSGSVDPIILIISLSVLVIFILWAGVWICKRSDRNRARGPALVAPDVESRSSTGAPLSDTSPAASASTLRTLPRFAGSQFAASDASTEVQGSTGRFLLVYEQAYAQPVRDFLAGADE